ncbi:MAG: ABC transporter ATP-binding protein [Thermodesulfobacteriota bacterium]
MDTVISVQSMSKKYRRYKSVADGVKEVLHPFRKKYHKEFWALKDISFEIKKGESVGIIGRNGSGKSTLLQLLCRIMQPTKGEIAVNGKISALLELGAGFHPEFTGRDNVFFYGAVMGISKDEMRDRLTEIAEFADIGDFIDEPVRTYSSGMFVRLAFASALHVSPDILIVDEALAVGDMEFQVKSLKKIEEFRNSDKNLLIVSHDMRTIKTLCDRVILLDNGTLEYDRKTDDTIDKYMSGAAERAAERARESIWPGGPGDQGESKMVSLSNVAFYNEEANETAIFGVGQTIVIKADITASIKVDNPVFGAIVYSETGIYLGGFNTLTTKSAPPSLEGQWKVEYHIEGIFLEGAYFVTLAIHDETGNIIYDLHDRVYSFVVRAASASLPYSGQVRIPCTWNFRKV